MSVYVKITGFNQEREILEFLTKLPKTEKVCTMVVKFQYTMNNHTYKDYLVGFHESTFELFAVGNSDHALHKHVSLSMFLATIEKSFNAQRTIVSGGDKTIAISQLAQNSTIRGLEEYVFGLIRKHTEYLISELALTQYPPDVLRQKTEQFINEKLK